MRIPPHHPTPNTGIVHTFKSPLNHQRRVPRETGHRSHRSDRRRSKTPLLLSFLFSFTPSQKYIVRTMFLSHDPIDLNPRRVRRGHTFYCLAPLSPSSCVSQNLSYFCFLKTTRLYPTVHFFSQFRARKRFSFPAERRGERLGCCTAQWLQRNLRCKRWTSRTTCLQQGRVNYTSSTKNSTRLVFPTTVINVILQTRFCHAKHHHHYHHQRRACERKKERKTRFIMCINNKQKVGTTNRTTGNAR